MDKYREMETRLIKMHNTEWMNVINGLKTMECDNENKQYFISYKKENQKKERSYSFNKVEYVQEQNGFNFIKYKNKFQDGHTILTDEAATIETLLDIDINSLEVRNKFKASDYEFSSQA